MEKTNILVVEDEAIVAAEIANTLKNMGYNVSGICSSGNETLKLLSKRKTDVILMDIQIKGTIDGIELASQIRRTLGIPVIFLTAFSDDSTLERAKIAEPFGYLSKSFYYKDIKTTIETAIYRNKMKLLVQEKEELLSLTLKNIDEAVITSEQDGRILFYNRRAEELFSFPDPSSPDAESPVVLKGVEFYLSTGEKVRNIFALPQLPEKLTLYKTEEAVFIPMECSVSKNLKTEKGGMQKVFVFRDLTSKQKIQEMEVLLSAIVENSEDVIAAVSLDGYVKSWNRGAERILGIPGEKAVGFNIGELLSQASLLEFSTLKEELQVFEFFFHTSSDDSKFISAHLSPLWNHEGVITGYSFIGRDLTARTNLERRIIEAEEKVRIRIGQDLHDSLGQQLTGVSLKIKALQNGIERGNYTQVTRISNELGELIKDAIKETRELSRGLIPAILTNEGLPQALQNLAEYSERVYGINTECNLEEMSLGEGVESQLYHIAQESINNAVKHGLARNIQINLSSIQAYYLLEIIDDGKGFIRGKCKKGLGLDNMRYRADIIKGSLNVESIPEEGTTVSCRVILQESKGGS